MTYLFRTYDDDKNVISAKFEEADGSYYQWIKDGPIQTWDEAKGKWKKASNEKVEKILIIVNRMGML